MTDYFSFLSLLTDRLRVRYSRTAEWEARMILRAAAGADWQTRAVSGEAVAPDAQSCALAMAERRSAGEPLAYILGDAPFGALDLKVGPGVLIPRVETELIVEAALRVCQKDFSRMTQIDALDLGTGTGNIALGLAAADPRIRVDAVENSADALRYAAHNTAQNPSLASRIQLIAMNYLTDSWAGNLKPSYHLILANPPYLSESDWAALPVEVRREPREALVAGPQGDEILRWIIEHAGRHLVSGGRMILEVGLGQAESLARFAESFCSLSCDGTVPDHQAIARVLVLRQLNLTA